MNKALRDNILKARKALSDGEDRIAIGLIIIALESIEHKSVISECQFNQGGHHFIIGDMCEYCGEKRQE